MELLASIRPSQRTSERKLMDAVQLDFVVTPFRAQKFVDLYRPAIKRPLTYGATGYLFYRNEDDPDHFIHLIFWEDRASFQRWWLSDEMQDIRAATVGLYGQPLLPKWNTVLEQG
jgi:heme-degrading monooxygenase HmoA